MKIEKIFWERTYLNIEFSAKEELSLSLKSEKNNVIFKIIKIKNNYYRARINLTIAYKNNMLPTDDYLLYSGCKNYFEEVQQTLKALSDPAVYVCDSIVASEIVDLIAMTAHFGITYTPLECMCKLEKYDYKLDDYLNDLADILSVLSKQKGEKDDVCHSFDYQNLVEYTKERLQQQRIYEKLNDNWLDQENKSLSNHYKKIISIEKSNFEY